MITPEQFGYERCSKEELTGGTPAQNAMITRDILDGRERGPKRQAVCLNAGAALYITGAAPDMASGVRMAQQLIDDGSAKKVLEILSGRAIRQRIEGMNQSLAWIHTGR